MGGHRVGSLPLLLIAAALSACFPPFGPEDDRERDPILTPFNLIAVLSEEVLTALGGDGSALGKADGAGAWIFLREDGLRGEEGLTPFPTANGRAVTLTTEVTGSAEAVVFLQLRSGSDPVFQGTLEATLTAGQPAELTIPVEPIPVALFAEIDTDLLFGPAEATEVRAFGLMATGDTIHDLPVTFTSLAPTVVEVEALTAASARLRALALGAAEIRARNETLVWQPGLVVDRTLLDTLYLQVVDPCLRPPGGAPALGEACPGTLAGEVRAYGSDDLLLGAELRLSYPSPPGDTRPVEFTDGAFGVSDLPIGEYTLDVSFAGFRPATARFRIDPETADEVVRIDLALADEASADPVGNVAGRVVTENGEPLVGAEVGLSGGEQTGGVFRTTVSREDGSYTFPGVVLVDEASQPIGAFTIVAAHEGFRTVTAPGITLQENTAVVNINAVLLPETAFPPVALATGSAHACALDRADLAWCWGSDQFGQLGDGPILADQPLPVTVNEGRAYHALVAGRRFTCALTSEGQAWCWGTDDVGQLGNGPPNEGRTYPVSVAGDHDFVRLAVGVGGSHACALDAAGQAWCWGSDSDGQLGDGAPSANQSAPVSVVGSHTFVSLTAAGSHTCGIDDGGQVWCWGSDDRGQLGNGESTGNRSDPVAVEGGLVFTHLTAGTSHTCGLDAAGGAWCWGSDDEGGLGDDGPLEDRTIPTVVVGSHRFIDIAAGDGHTCAVDESRQAWCWGYGGLGQLGNGVLYESRPFPVMVGGSHAFVGIAAGDRFTCGRTALRSVWCWGYDLNGRLGDGPAWMRRSVPSRVGSPF